MKLLFLIFFSCSVFATPKNLQIWFVSNKKSAFHESQWLEKKIYFSQKIVARECQEMGDYCFDPQVGLYQRDGFQITSTPKNESDFTLKLESSVDRNMIECERGLMFDIFCGKEKQVPVNPVKIEVWIDTSSSMREFDPPQSSGGCFRKNFADRILLDCSISKKPRFKVFDTSLKDSSSSEAFCTNQGLNDYKKLMEGIEQSEADQLIIITDIYEFTKEFADFVESKGGSFRGDKDALEAKELVDQVSDLAKSCQ